MIDSHTHTPTFGTQHFICEPFSGEPGENDVCFLGHHPWEFLDALPPEGWLDNLRERLLKNPSAGVGEIGLDRLKQKSIPDAMQEAFEAQLSLASYLHRPVVLHGAKCWGRVVSTIKRVLDISAVRNQSIPSFLFHGFSRSAGLIPEIVSLNGFISVSSAILNDHAINYRKMVSEIPLDILLVETDYTGEGDCASLEAMVLMLAKLRSLSTTDLEHILDQNAHRFISSLPTP